MKIKEIVLADIHQCTGCALCADVCPTDSISLRADAGLHTYPKIDKNTCIECGKCMSICPTLTPIDDIDQQSVFEQTIFCAWNTDDEERMKATSGGVGGALAKYAIENGYYVCGAAFDEKWNLSHVLSNQVDVLDKIRGSKYLQSNTEGIYKEVKKIITSGQKVLFLGTPCQIEAIKRMVPKSQRHLLLTCGIICHGVNSPIVWSDYVNYLEQKRSSKLTGYNFRSKTKGWGTLRIRYEFGNNKVVDCAAWANLFHVWFGNHYTMRESCFKCQYRIEQRNSDLTIGDFWGIDKLLPDMNTEKGISALIVSSMQGNEFFEKCYYMESLPMDYAKSIAVLKGFIYRGNLDKTNAEIERNKTFEKDYMSCGFGQMADKYPASTTSKQIIAYIKSRLHLK